jgi:hypothetical protein
MLRSARSAGVEALCLLKGPFFPGIGRTQQIAPFRPVALDSISNTIPPPPRRPTNLELMGFVRIPGVSN